MPQVDNPALLAALAIAVVGVVIIVALVLILARRRNQTGEAVTRRRLKHARMTSEDLAKDLVENVNVDTPATTAVLDVLIQDPDLLPKDYHQRVDATVGIATEPATVRIDEQLIERLKTKLDDMPAYLERISSGRFVTAAPGEDADVAVWEDYLSTGMVFKEEALWEAVSDMVDDLPVVDLSEIEIDPEQEAEKQQRMVADGVLVDPAVPGVLPEDVTAAARGLAQVQKRKRSKSKSGLLVMAVPMPGRKKTSPEPSGKNSAGKPAPLGFADSAPKGIDWRDLGLPEDIPYAFINQR